MKFSSLAPIIIIVIISIVSKLLKAKKKSNDANKTIYFDKNGKPINQDNQNTKKKGLFSYIETLKQEISKQQKSQIKSYEKKSYSHDSLKKTEFTEKKYKDNEDNQQQTHSNKSTNLNLKLEVQEKVEKAPNKLITNRSDLKKAIVFSEILNAKYVN